jgi:hypothetical protein
MLLIWKRRKKMSEQYRPLESKIWNSEAGEVVRNSARAFVGGAALLGYATGVTPLRIPTAVRKMRNKQTAFHDNNYAPLYRVERNSVVEGFCVTGGLIGTLAAMNGIMNVVAQPLISLLDYGNPVPAIVAGSVFAATNLASGIYEIARAPRSRVERISGKLDAERGAS